MSWQEVQFHSSGLSEENVMKGLLGEAGEGANRGQTMDGKHPEISQSGKPLSLPGLKGKGEGNLVPEPGEKRVLGPVS